MTAADTELGTVELDGVVHKLGTGSDELCARPAQTGARLRAYAPTVEFPLMAAPKRERGVLRCLDGNQFTGHRSALDGERGNEAQGRRNVVAHEPHIGLSLLYLVELDQVLCCDVE